MITERRGQQSVFDAYPVLSFSINYETNLVLYDEAVTRELESDFLADLEHCVLFKADEYQAQKTSSRLVDSVMRLGSPLI